MGRFDMNDVLLGPEMHSTGEVMGIGRTFGEAYSKRFPVRVKRCRTRVVCSFPCATETSPC